MGVKRFIKSMLCNMDLDRGHRPGILGCSATKDLPYSQVCVSSTEAALCALASTRSHRSWKRDGRDRSELYGNLGLPGCVDRGKAFHAFSARSSHCRRPQPAAVQNRGFTGALSRWRFRGGNAAALVIASCVIHARSRAAP